jgi:hypothetical protein
MTKRVIVVVLVATLVGAMATAAFGAVRAGRYGGKTVQDARVSFTVLANKRFVVRYRLEGAVLDCSNNDSIQLEGFTTPLSNRIPIRASTGRFSFGVESGDVSVGAEVTGTIRSPRAFGTIRMAARLNDQGELDPNGDITCDSGSVRWTARRR